MPTDVTTERMDLSRLADDGCPNTTGDTQVYDLSKLWPAGPADEAG